MCIYVLYIPVLISEHRCLAATHKFTGSAVANDESRWWSSQWGWWVERHYGAQHRYVGLSQLTFWLGKNICLFFVELCHSMEMGKGKSLRQKASTLIVALLAWVCCAQHCFAISEVATDWRELMVLQWPFIAHSNGQLDCEFSWLSTLQDQHLLFVLNKHQSHRMHTFNKLYICYHCLYGLWLVSVLMTMIAVLLTVVYSACQYDC